MLAERMVGLGGLEPPTSRLSSARSNQLSYKPVQTDTSQRLAPRDKVSQGRQRWTWYWPSRLVPRPRGAPGWQAAGTARERNQIKSFAEERETKAADPLLGMRDGQMTFCRLVLQKNRKGSLPRP
jgi:hypothetical protein